MQNQTSNNLTRGQRKRGNNRSRQQYPGLTQLIPAYPRQPVFAVSLQSIPIKLTTTVTSGIITSVTGLDSDIIQMETALFTVFEEYRIVGADISLTMFSSINSGIIKMWVDEKTSTTPTATAALQAVGKVVNCSSVDRLHTLKWRPSDPTDLEYTDGSGNPNPAYLKFYTDNLSFGSPIAVTALGVAVVTLHFQLRGMSSD